MPQLTSIALFFGFLHLVIGLPVLLYQDGFRKRLSRILGKPSNLQLFAFPWFIIGYLMIASYPWVNKTAASWVSVFGYLMLLRSVIWFWFPGFVSTKVKGILKSGNGMTVIGLLLVAVGVLFAYLGWKVY